MADNQQPKKVTAKEMLFEAFTQDNGVGAPYVTLEIEIMHEKICKVMEAFAKAYYAQQNSLQNSDVVFVKRYIGKGEFPIKTGIYHTDLGRINWFEGLKSFEHSARVEYWLEELTVPFINDVRWVLGEGIVKEVLGRYTKEEISFGKMVELLNTEIQKTLSTSTKKDKLITTVTEAYNAKDKALRAMTKPVALADIEQIIAEWFKSGSKNQTHLANLIYQCLPLIHSQSSADKKLEELRDWALDVEMNSTSREIHLFARQVKEKTIHLLGKQNQSKLDFVAYDKERFPETVDEVKEYERTGILPKERLTIQQCKDKVAQKYGYKDWADLAKQADRPLEYLKEIRELYHS